MATLGREKIGRTRAKRRPWSVRWIGREELQALLTQGFRPKEIADARRVTVNAVTRAIASLDIVDLVDIIAHSWRWREKSQAEVKPVDVKRPPVDVMEVVLSVLDDAKILRDYFDSDRGKATLTERQRLQVLDVSMQRRMDWAKTFIDTRIKLMELISVDTWIRELLEMVEQVGTEVFPSLGPNAGGLLRTALLDRIRERLIGRSIEQRGVIDARVVRVDDDDGKQAEQKAEPAGDPGDPSSPPRTPPGASAS